MADYDLEALSLSELKKMQKDVAKAISTFEDRQKAEARAKVEALAREIGYSLAELVGTETKSARSPAAAKYRHPENQKGFKVDDFYAARSRTIPPLPWSNIAPPFSPSASYGGTRDAAKSPRNAGGRCARKNHSGSRIWHRDQVAPPDTRHRRRVSTHDPAQRSHARRKI